METVLFMVTIWRISQLRRIWRISEMRTTRRDLRYLKTTTPVLDQYLRVIENAWKTSGEGRCVGAI
jgi:hypothetical protein